MCSSLQGTPEPSPVPQNWPLSGRRPLARSRHPSSGHRRLLKSRILPDRRVARETPHTPSATRSRAQPRVPGQAQHTHARVRATQTLSRGERAWGPCKASPVPAPNGSATVCLSPTSLQKDAEFLGSCREPCAVRSRTSFHSVCFSQDRVMPGEPPTSPFGGCVWAGGPTTDTRLPWQTPRTYKLARGTASHRLESSGTVGRSMDD